MELKDFITESLKQITEGIINAQNTIDKTEINPIGFTGSVEFDISVSVNKSKDSSLGVGLNVLSITGSAKKGKGESNYSESRLKFSLPVVFPSK